ncbi:MAG: PAS domain-containing protein [Actinobacteria bacterium]|nr:PAS domain-containing protein [Actinomycetota bacterium]
MEEPGRPASPAAAEPLDDRTDLKYRTLVEQVPAVVYIALLGDEGDWLYVSPQIEGLMGYTPEEWLAHPEPFGGHVNPEDRDRVWRLELARSVDGLPFRTEYRMRTRDGREIWIRDEAVMVRDGEGRPLFWQGLLYDITEQRNREEELRQAQEDRRLLLERLLFVVEEERTRTAVELHDGPIQGLTAVQLQLETARRMVETGDPSAWEIVALQAQDGLTREIERLRSLMHDLRPPVLDRGGLVAALHQLAAGSRQRAEPRVSVRAGAVRRFERGLETALYRLAQEAVANAVRHGGARSVEIEVTGSEQEVRLEVRDDGAGFDVAAAEDVASSQHFGILGMRERMRMAGGRLEIRSAPGEGCTVRAVVPIPLQDG